MIKIWRVSNAPSPVRQIIGNKDSDFLVAEVPIAYLDSLPDFDWFISPATERFECWSYVYFCGPEIK